MNLCRDILKKFFKETNRLFGFNYTDFKTRRYVHADKIRAFKLVSAYFLVKEYADIDLVAHLTGLKKLYD